MSRLIAALKPYFPARNIALALFIVIGLTARACEELSAAPQGAATLVFKLNPASGQWEAVTTPTRPAALTPRGDYYGPTKKDP